MGSEYPYQASQTPETKLVEHNGATFHTALWKTAKGTEPRGRIVFVHGFGEYTKVYDRLLDHLSQRGFEVFFFDQRGAGLTSPGKLRGITDEFHVFDDLDFFLKQNLDDVGPGHNLYLMGHSMGGGIALNYGIHGQFRHRIAGILVTAPLILLHPKSRPHFVLEALFRLILRVKPNFKIDTGLKDTYITSHQGYMDFLKNDPNVHPLLATARQASDFIARGEKLMDKNYTAPFNIPVVIFHGLQDYVNDPNGSRIFIDNLAIEDKTLVEIPNCRHSVNLETDDIYESYLEQAVDWLSNHPAH